MPKYPQPTRRPAVVSGAASGFGAAAALWLAKAGHPVALGARRVDRCAALVEQIRGEGGAAVAHPLDVTDPSSVDAFAKAITGELGDIEVLVSNAGRVGPGTVHEVETDRFAAEIDLNLV